MSEEPKKLRKLLGLPPFYWAAPPKPSRKGFVNGQQRRFHLIMTALKVAKVAAIAAVALMIIGVI
ncbi:MAG: hypothetical protein JRM79_00875 [Nitrososphaerota archaeon]|jgi:hypothetical protein|nr:hypothetical protein [Nitrososphaerota archaeon]MCL5672093.1 hypothetical protein [Nitrososphaerota archaeon]MDG6903627.1 hypothetical protein [Nitrososphaerota archaeon]MDG6911923.1 hypothetical protein [Nitrososphaerota archaeon]MDG6924476.1 hypothetical protein [Nitrososphaerota archaeon]